MKVSIAVNGHFHAIQLAHQLEKRNCLQQFITTYPKRYFKHYTVESPNVRIYFSQELLKRTVGRLRYLTDTLDVDTSFSSRFDRLVKKRLMKSDIFVGFAGSVLETLKKAKSQGAITVVERGSAHILTNDKILMEEYAQQGFKKKFITNQKYVENELIEYEFADYISVPSTYVADTFVNNYIPKEKIVVTPYGSNFPILNTLQKKSEEFSIVFCGLCSYQKGVHYLLQAFSELRLKLAKCYIIGSVSEDFLNVQKKYNHENIIFTGSLAKPQIIDIFSRAHVFCLPSLQDGMGMVTLEAMACGLPVICTENTGAKDIIENGVNGWIIPIRSVSLLKEKILTLYEDRNKCYEMGEYAKKKVATDFSWDSYGCKMISHYKAMMLGSNRGLR